MREHRAAPAKHNDAIRHEDERVDDLKEKFDAAIVLIRIDPGPVSSGIGSCVP
jgi:hypothetical protein